MKVGGEGDDRGWDGWMASLTQGTWVWAKSGTQRRTGKPGMLQFMGLQSGTWLSDWAKKVSIISWRLKKNSIAFKYMLSAFSLVVHQVRTSPAVLALTVLELTALHQDDVHLNHCETAALESANGKNGSHWAILKCDELFCHNCSTPSSLLTNSLPYCDGYKLYLLSFEGMHHLCVSEIWIWMKK